MFRVDSEFMTMKLIRLRLVSVSEADLRATPSTSQSILGLYWG